MRLDNWKKELITIPNLLSLFRLALIPVYVAIYLKADSSMDYFVAAMILAVSCLTDLIDGKIARHFNMISNVGKILDPLADKATQFTLIVCLSVKYPVLQGLILLFVIKEGFQLIAGAVNLHKGIMLKGAQLSGKICTTVLFISLILMVMMPDLPYQYVVLITVIDLLFMAISFADYCITYAKREHKFQSVDADP